MALQERLTGHRDDGLEVFPPSQESVRLAMALDSPREPRWWNDRGAVPGISVSLGFEVRVKHGVPWGDIRRAAKDAIEAAGFNCGDCRLGASGVLVCDLVFRGERMCEVAPERTTSCSLKLDDLLDLREEVADSLSEHCDYVGPATTGYETGSWSAINVRR